MNNSWTSPTDPHARRGGSHHRQDNRQYLFNPWPYHFEHDFGHYSINPGTIGYHDWTYASPSPPIYTRSHDLDRYYHGLRRQRRTRYFAQHDRGMASRIRGRGFNN